MITATLLPADIYTVVNKTVLTDIDRNNLINLYLPIIGVSALSLYLLLWRDLSNTMIISNDHNHHHLMSSLKLDLFEIKAAREALEAVGLIKTFINEGEINKYVYELYSPLTSYEFFNHPIFNVILYNNIGKSEYEALKMVYDKISIDMREYTDITKLMDMTFKVSNTEINVNPLERTTNSICMSDQVDFDLILSSIPKSLINEKVFTKKMKELINNLAFTYNIDTIKMVELIRTSINEHGGIDKESLRKNARKYYQYNNNGALPTLCYRTQPEYLKNPLGDLSKRGKIIAVFENTTPYDFLKSKNKGHNPTNRDLKIVEYLLVDIGLKPAVVNVLIDYVLKKNDNKLNQSFIEAIASQWSRLGIETASDAMDTAEKQNKKYNKRDEIKEKYKAATPNWFNSNQEKEEISEEERKELESLMSKYR